MKFEELALSGVWLIRPEAHTDERGVFRRHFCAREFAERGLIPAVVQGNLSENPHRHTLRGFHYQMPPHAEAKTLSCLAGAIYDIVVDMRENSINYMKWVAVELSAEGREALYIPPGFANAWLTMVDRTTLHYYMSQYFSPDAARFVRYDDPAFGFQWPVVPKIISERDRKIPDFRPQDRIGVRIR